MSTIYREYVSDDSFVQHLQKMKFRDQSQLQIVVCLARDYDGSRRKSDGIFQNVIHSSITPEVIDEFKKKSPSKVKFYLCIGGRDDQFPFSLDDKSIWISNATRTLGAIIHKYKFDGIDVFYPRIRADDDDFVEAIDGLVTNLRTWNPQVTNTKPDVIEEKPHVITEASISTSQNVESPYLKLYRKNPSNFQYVVYQVHDGFANNPINDAKALLDIFTGLTSNNNYPIQNLLVGYSIRPKDWNIIPYPVITTAVPLLLNNGNKTLARGISVWTVTEEP